MSSKAKTKPLLGWFDIYVGNRGYNQDGTDFVTDAPMGVELDVREAEKSAPVFMGETPWERRTFFSVQVKKENGKFKMWYAASGEEAGQSALCYAESDDGFEWHRPNLGLIEYRGSTQNNMCATGKLAFAASVFEDPSACPEERYKTISMEGRWEDAEGNELPPDEGVRRFQDLHREQEQDPEIEPNVFLRGAVFGGTSPDGFRWKTLEEPLLTYFCDTQNLAYYDEELQSYVAYVRTHGPHGRSIGRIVASEFKDWPQPQVVFHADPQDPPDVDLYSNCYCLYPGCESLHLMFPAVYHHITDHADVQLATSVNGVTWTRPARLPVIPCGVAGSGEEGGVYAGPELLMLDEKRMGLLYHGVSQLHNVGFLEAPPDYTTHYAWAIWPKDRLMGIRSRQQGEFTLISRHPCGEPIRLNYACETGGWVRMELVSQVPYPPQMTDGIKGFTFDDCELLTGDELAWEVRWKGSADVSRLAGQEIHIRFELFRATVFAVTL